MYKYPLSLNPYYDYDAVRDLSMFFGRKDELQILYNAIDKRQCFSIVGSRHIGKSSLLKFLGNPEMQRLSGYNLQDRLFILVDLREYTQKTREDFFSSVCDQIIIQSQGKVSFRTSPLDGASKFKKLLEDIKRGGFRPVLLMDAFDKITQNIHFDPDFFSFLRALAGVYDLISYVTASIKPLYDVCHSDAVASSPFFNIFQTCNLGPLTSKEAQELITIPAQKVKYAFDAGEVAWVLTQAGFHPFFLQVTCRLLFMEKLRQDEKDIDFEAVQRKVYQELIHHFDHAWNDLSDEQHKVLRLEAIQRVGSERRFPELSQSALFYKRMCELSKELNPFIEIKDVKEALDDLDDTDFLGGCSLSTTQYVTLHAGVESSQTKKGIVVRDFLKDAFERMRPGNIRSDSAPEWRLYNILWYHYFKYHLPNPQTAARLGIGSTRQFYREQERAIQALAKELLEIDADSYQQN